uniref:Major facilitator superfamily (MFS) profile domain-containing protein n=1 Tax=Fagus sylvatica TaxID=28930 RepID=A0A2N9EW45_FAGSY
MALKVLSALDTAKTQLYHFKAIMIAGMGLFTDAYDFFCITPIMKLIYYKKESSRSKKYVIPSLLATALVGAAIGQLVFGRLGDRIGRRRVYGLALMIMVLSSIECGFSMCTTKSCVLVTLGFFRFILGIGIGGDYPLSATIMSEFANKRTRGAFIAAVFQCKHGRPDKAFSDGRPETKNNSDDGRKTPVGCRPKIPPMLLSEILWRIINRNFFLGVCRIAESEGRPINFGDLIPSSCVLHHLSEELFELVSPALNTWREVRELMVSEGGSWTSVRSEDLPEGLSDRDEGSRSLEETPSISGSSQAVGPEDSWTARSYLSKVVDSDELDRYRRKYQIPEDVVLRIPESDEVACSSRYGDVAFYEADFNAGIRFPMQPLMRELLDRLNLALGQLAPNAWRMVVGSMVMWKVLSDGKDDLTIDELLFCYKPCQIPASPGFWSLNMRQRGLKLIDDNFIPVRREWGVPSSSALKRPKLNSDGHNRVLRALHHNEHHFKHFIRPELLALYSFGPEPSEVVLSLQEINQKRMATAKLNREKLRKMMSQQDEAPLTLGKKRKAESSSKKVTDERALPPPPPPVQKPSIPDPVPASSIEVIDVPTEPSSSRSREKVPTLPRDASLACRRAKSVVTKDDVGEYDKVNTDVIKVAGVHSLMKGLTELTVIANRCLQWEKALMKHKVQLSEAAQANQRLTALVNELTLDRDRVVVEMASFKVKMAVKEDELKKETAGRRNADERLERLTSQMEAIKVSAVEEFKSSEAYDDNNTKYFLTGFSLLKRQAKEKYPDLDFEAFQPFEDDESVMPVEEVDGGTTAVDPQLDDDAAS